MNVVRLRTGKTVPEPAFKGLRMNLAAVVMGSGSDEIWKELRRIAERPHRKPGMNYTQRLVRLSIIDRNLEMHDITRAIIMAMTKRKKDGLYLTEPVTGRELRKI